MSAMPHGESGSAQKKFKSRSKKMRTRKKIPLKQSAGRQTASREFLIFIYRVLIYSRGNVLRRWSGN